jgi:hypothetical protein
MFLTSSYSLIKNIFESVWVKFSIWTKHWTKKPAKRSSSTHDKKHKASYEDDSCTAQQNEQINSAFLPVHIPLVLLVQLNQIIFLWIRSPVVCFKFFNFSFSNLWFVKKRRMSKQVYLNASGNGISYIKQIPSCTLFWKTYEDSEHLLQDPDFHKRWMSHRPIPQHS